MEDMKVVDTQIFLFTRKEGGGVGWDATFAVNDKFLIHLTEDGKFSIPRSDEACWKEKSDQDEASEKYDANDLAISLGLPTAFADVWKASSMLASEYYKDRSKRSGA